MAARDPDVLDSDVVVDLEVVESSIVDLGKLPGKSEANAACERVTRDIATATSGYLIHYI